MFFLNMYARNAHEISSMLVQSQSLIRPLDVVAEKSIREAKERLHLVVMQS